MNYLNRLKLTPQSILAILLGLLSGASYSVVIEGQVTPGQYQPIAVDINSGGLTTSPNLLTCSFSTSANVAQCNQDVSAYRSVCVQITAAASGTYTFQLSNNNSNFAGAMFQEVTSTTTGLNVATTTPKCGSTRGMKYFQLLPSGISGTGTGVVTFSTTDLGYTFFGSAIQSGNWNVGIAASTTGGYSTSIINTATTAVIKSGAGTLHTISVGKAGITSTLQCYDNTSGSGTKITGLMDTSAPLASWTFDSAFTTGLTCVTAGLAELVVTYK